VEQGMEIKQFQPNPKGGEFAPGAKISLVVAKEKGETVEEIYGNAVMAGAIALKPPAEKQWGQEVAYLKNCIGFLVEICTPVQVSQDSTNRHTRTNSRINICWRIELKMC
jgi:uncharacterized glyoxalase superfamily protein PhnB